VQTTLNSLFNIFVDWILLDLLACNIGTFLTPTLFTVSTFENNSWQNLAKQPCQTSSAISKAFGSNKEASLQQHYPAIQANPQVSHVERRQA